MKSIPLDVTWFCELEPPVGWYPDAEKALPYCPPVDSLPPIFAEDLSTSWLDTFWDRVEVGFVFAEDDLWGTVPLSEAIPPHFFIGTAPRPGQSPVDALLDAVSTNFTAAAVPQDASPGVDILRGTRDSDAISGLSGADILVGHGGDDSLRGGKGWDALLGGDGDDVLIGGRGDDFLLGGEGADVFHFREGSGRDLIEDFEVGVDTISIGRGARSMDELTFIQDGADVLVRFADVEIVVDEITVETLAVADHFAF